LGAEGRGFESLRPDQRKLLIINMIFSVLTHASAFSCQPSVDDFETVGASEIIVRSSSHNSPRVDE
jgi:hypothetical protein